jgi:hypothetical protein
MNLQSFQPHTTLICFVCRVILLDLLGMSSKEFIESITPSKGKKSKRMGMRYALGEKKATKEG